MISLNYKKESRVIENCIKSLFPEGFVFCSNGTKRSLAEPLIETWSLLITSDQGRG